jgi:hypothetical protein
MKFSVLCTLFFFVSVAAFSPSARIRSSPLRRNKAVNLFSGKMNADVGAMSPKAFSESCRKVAIVSIASIVLSGFGACKVALADDSNAGTKTDKKFELCISKCVFNETKPPPVGASTERLESTRTRGEILKDCKVTCATTKEQLMLGKPKPKQDN